MWDQGQYYNALCPTDAAGPDGHVYTGCVATAMAQIINYWGYPTSGRGTHSYDSPYGTLEVNYEESAYDFDNMPAALTATSTPDEVQAVAKLMYDCGVAVNMTYGSSESGADIYAVSPALVDYFKLNHKLGLTNSSYFSGQQWLDLLKQNILQSCPVLYSDISIAHAYVVDGYTSDGYYHINWGWGGYADGWFLLDTNAIYDAIIGIYPDSSSTTIIGQSLGKSTFLVDSVLNFKHMYAETEWPNDVYTGGAIPQTITFTTNDTSDRIVIDIISYDEHTPSLCLYIYDGADESAPLLRHLEAVGDISPIVTSSNKITIYYTCVQIDAGFHLQISKQSECRMISDLVISEDSVSKEISWTENGIATQWLVEYGPLGFDEGTGVSEIVDTPYCKVVGISLDIIYEIRVSPVCESKNTMRSIVINNYKYWTDIVNSEPAGYVTDSNNVIHIYSEKGLAWLAKNAGANGYDYDYCLHDIIIESDLDLSEYLWRPIPTWFGKIDGGGHVIRNMNVSELWADFAGGLFSNIMGDTIKDLGIENANVDSYNAGAFGYHMESVMINCYSINGSIKSSAFSAGGLVGGGGTMVNCFSTGSISPAFMGGGIYGDGAPKMYNCYSIVQEITGMNIWKGLLGGYTGRGYFDNCFASIDYIPDTWSSAYIGHMYDAEHVNEGYFFGHIENVEFIRNVSGFTRDSSTSMLHTTPNVSLNYLYDGSVDLVEVLNKWVIERNSPDCRTWVWDSIRGLPIFGEYYEVECPNVNNVVLNNIDYQDGYAVVVSWQENGEASQWAIKCMPRDSDDEDSATIFYAITTTDTLTGLTIGRLYDIYIRPICGNDEYIIWGSPYTIWVDKPYWTDIVTTKPNGYYEDEQGNIVISSAEGLAWLSVCSNGLNGQPIENYDNKNISLSSDLDMGKYRWTSISQYENDGRDLEFRGVFNGKSHCIKNITVHEDRWLYAGLIGNARNAVLRNINIQNSTFSVTSGYIGSLIGYASDVVIDNCHSINILIQGYRNVGGLVGVLCEEGYLANSHSSGNVIGDEAVGGLVGFGGPVRNCYSTVNVNVGDGVSSSKGGLTGAATDVFENIYSAGNVEYSYNMYGNSIGSVLGELYPNCVVRNTYGIMQEQVPLFGSTSWGEHIISDTATFSSDGHLLTTPSIDNNTYTDLLSALNAWVDAYDTAGIYRHWAADSTGENGGFPVFAAIPCSPATGGDSIVACDSYTWQGVLYTAPVELTDTLSSANGCDSIVTHHIVINHSTALTDTLAATDSLTWIDGITYRESNISASVTYPTELGCDSTVHLWLTITKTYRDTLTITDTITLAADTIVLTDTLTITQYDTAYITLYDTTYLTQHDTAYINVPVHDTVYLTQTDTVYNTIIDTMNNYIHDTTTIWQTDTLWLTDTVYSTDTVYIRDTVYVGVDDVEQQANVKLYNQNSQVVVEGAQGYDVVLYDAIGRRLDARRDDFGLLRFDVPASGTYLIKVGNHPARRIVVVR